MNEGAILMRCFGLQNAGDHLQARIPQTLNATTSHSRIRVSECHDHTLNAGLNHSLRAGRGAALMTAGLERNDDRSTLSSITGLSKRTHLGMSFSCLGMKAFTHQGPV
jgi:hypothetical protein